jgi:hypothetical protein
MPTFLWVVYDIILFAVGLWFLERNLTRREKVVMFGLAAIGLAIAVYSGRSDYEQSTLMSSLKEGQQFTEGQLTAISRMLGTPNIASINDLKGQLESVSSAVKQYAMPRMLTDAQTQAIASYLLRFQPQTVTLTRLMQGNFIDPEASHYADQIRQALMKGGWKVQLNDGEIANVGLQIETETKITNQVYLGRYVPTPPDPEHPTPDILLIQAFRQAGIEMDGVTSGSGPNYKCSLAVGRRPVTLNLPKNNGNSN